MGIKQVVQPILFFNLPFVPKVAKKIVLGIVLIAKVPDLNHVL